MLDEKTIAALAAELHDAEKRRTQVRHFSKRHPQMTIADGRPDAGYVHARLEVGAGRGAETLKAAGDAVFETMKSHFARRYESQGLALSLEVVEFGESGTWKHNNLHARFKDKA